LNPPDLKTARAHLEAAGRLIASARDLVQGWRPAHAGEEIVRRELELVAHGLHAWISEVRDGLIAARMKLDPNRCPHCAWSREPLSVARCPRCNGPRAVRDETGQADRRGAA
jgi:ssDNA-binding Zn-finger/Zn-ribbon topoisomerase 1